MQEDAQRPIRSGSGFSLEGPGFYVWDQDRRQVLEAAADLGRGRRPVRRTKPPGVSRGRGGRRGLR